MFFIINITNLNTFILIFMKKIIVVTGGAGFIGSNLISYIVKNTEFRIVSIDNYSAGRKKKSY